MSIPIGLQLFSVREHLDADPWGTLAAVADAGFTRFEAANHRAREDPGVGFGVGASELRARLSDLGLSIVGCHINPLDVDILPPVLDYQAELGNPRIGCDIEFYRVGDRDDVLRRAERMNQVGEMARARGMQFCYHNHFQEFQRIGDQLVYEILLENTDPELVTLEMDTYWMQRGGQDPVAWIRRCADRVALLHQKDFPADAPQPLNLFDGVVGAEENIDMELFEQRQDPRCFTEIGHGVLPIQEIVDAAAQAARLEAILLEQDHSQLDEIDSIRASRRAFSETIRGVRFE
jgi:sugar phosphate isomerase/epimerase